MDAFDANEENESQATQMLQELLDVDTSSSRKPSETRGSALRSQFVQPNDVSSDSLPSSRTSISIPPYHFHGLASTQTQSQRIEDEDLIGGSQKENIGTAKSNKGLPRSIPSPASRSHSPNAPSSKADSKVTNVDQRDTSLLYTEKGPNSRPTVTFQSPRPSVTKTSNPVTRLNPYKSTLQPSTRPKPPSRTSSQDSFACDPDNTEDLFVAKSEKFAVPLSELGHGSSPGRDVADSGSSRLDMFTGRHVRVSSSPPRGRVLVEATPSNSASSQSQGERRPFNQFEATQIVDQPVLAPTVVDGGNASGYESSEPSSSYGRFLKGERDPEPEREMQPTQPSTEVEDSNMQDINYSNFWSIAPSVPTAPSVSHPRPGPRSLIGMVRPENRYRYKEYAENSAIAASTQTNIRLTDELRKSSKWEETQPTFPQHASHSPANFSHISPNFPSSSKSGLRKNTSPVMASPVGVDSMDIVPDSEPFHVNQTLASHKNQLENLTSTNRKAIRPIKNNGNGVDDEMEVDDREIEARADTEDDQDVPLAVTHKRPRGRPPKKASDKAKMTPKLRTTNKTKYTPHYPSKPGHSWETGEVPSSVPDQDIVKDARKNPAMPGKMHDLRPKATQRYLGSGQRSRSTSTIPKNAGKENLSEKLSSGSGDNGTELAEDDEDYGGTPLHRKRKPILGKKIRADLKRQKLATPSTRKSGKLRSGMSIGPRSGTRVFALWKQDAHYYPGTVHSFHPNSQYQIKFDDATDGFVTVEQLRKLQLQVGDDVLWQGRSRPAKVVNVQDDAAMVKVDLDGHPEDINISDIRIATKTILYAWSDRMLPMESITTTMQPAKIKLSPSPSKISVASFPAVRGNRKKVLAKTGLIVTLSATNGNWEKEKEGVMNAVKNSGGFVVDDLSTIIRIEGKHYNNNNRWVITKSDVKWIGNDDIERLFLLADDPNQKPKFLIALALGIPCLSTAWLYESVEGGEEKEWLGYMLPQGYSSALNARPSQQVDVDWGNSVHQLKNILSNFVACKIFADKSILCIGHEMISQPKGKRRVGDDKIQEAMSAAPQIILAMGAEFVETVSEARYASLDLSQYDYVVLREAGQYLSDFSECTTVHWDWVKECLIASRYLPLPTWTTAECSQEA